MKIIKRYYSVILTAVFLFNYITPTLYAQQNSDKKIDGIVTKYFKDDKPGGVVLVAKEGGVLFQKAYGLKDIKNNAPLTTSTLFALGSVSKQFTAIAIYILAEQGKLYVDDDLSKFYPNIEKFKGIKIFNLLSHTSGLKDLFSISGWREDLSKNMSPQEVLDLISAEELKFEPGEKTDYSNSGYHILGLIVEMLSGKSYNEFIKENIFDPLEMNSSYFIGDEIPSTRAARGYEKVNEKIITPGVVDESRFYAGGSIITTVSDMLKWDEGLYKNRLISEDMKAEYFKAVVLNNGEQSTMASGWETLNFNGAEMYGHGGGINGFVSQVYRIPGEHLYVVILSNLVNRDHNYSITEIAQQIILALFEGKTFEAKEVAYLIPLEELKNYAGIYILPDGSSREIITENGNLFYKISEDKKAELFAQSKSTFRAGKASKIVFEIDKNGIITGFEIFTGRGRSVKGTKNQ